MASIRAMAVCGALLIGTTGCAGLAESAMETAVEKAAEANAENGEDIEIDFDFDNGTAEVSVDGNTGGMGADLDRPDWLEDYELPPGLSIHLHFEDADTGEAGLSGQTLEMTMAEVLEHQRAAARDHGFIEDAEQSTAGSLVAEAPDGRSLVVVANTYGDVTAYSLALDGRSG